MSGKASRRLRKQKKRVAGKKGLPQEEAWFQDVLRMHAASFRKRFGRDPRDGDPMVWDPDEAGDEPVPMPFLKNCIQTFDELEKTSGLYPKRLLYAYAYTGWMNHPEATGRTDIPVADVREYEDLVTSFMEMSDAEQVIALKKARERVHAVGAGPSPEEIARRREEAAAAAPISQNDPYLRFSVEWLIYAKVRDTAGPEDAAANLMQRCRTAAKAHFGKRYDEERFGAGFNAGLAAMIADRMGGGPSGPPAKG